MSKNFRLDSIQLLTSQIELSKKDKQSSFARDHNLYCTPKRKISNLTNFKKRNSAKSLRTPNLEIFPFIFGTICGNCQQIEKNPQNTCVGRNFMLSQNRFASSANSSYKDLQFRACSQENYHRPQSSRNKKFMRAKNRQFAQDNPFKFQKLQLSDAASSSSNGKNSLLKDQNQSPQFAPIVYSDNERSEESKNPLNAESVINDINKILNRSDTNLKQKEMQQQKLHSRSHSCPFYTPHFKCNNNFEKDQEQNCEFPTVVNIQENEQQQKPIQINEVDSKSIQKLESGIESSINSDSNYNSPFISNNNSLVNQIHHSLSISTGIDQIQKNLIIYKALKQNKNQYKTRGGEISDIRSEKQKFQVDLVNADHHTKRFQFFKDLNNNQHRKSDLFLEQYYITQEESNRNDINIFTSPFQVKDNSFVSMQKCSYVLENEDFYSSNKQQSSLDEDNSVTQDISNDKSEVKISFLHNEELELTNQQQQISIQEGIGENYFREIDSIKQMIPHQTYHQAAFSKKFLKSIPSTELYQQQSQPQDEDSYLEFNASLVSVPVNINHRSRSKFENFYLPMQNQDSSKNESKIEQSFQSMRYDPQCSVIHIQQQDNYNEEMKEPYLVHERNSYMYGQQSYLNCLKQLQNMSTPTPQAILNLQQQRLVKFTGGFYPASIWGLKGGAMTTKKSDVNTNNNEKKNPPTTSSNITNITNQMNNPLDPMTEVEKHRRKLEEKAIIHQIQQEKKKKQEDEKQKQDQILNSVNGCVVSSHSNISNTNNNSNMKRAPSMNQSSTPNIPENNSNKQSSAVRSNSNNNNQNISNVKINEAQATKIDPFKQQPWENEIPFTESVMKVSNLNKQVSQTKNSQLQFSGIQIDINQSNINGGKLQESGNNQSGALKSQVTIADSINNASHNMYKKDNRASIDQVSKLNPAYQEINSQNVMHQNQVEQFIPQNIQKHMDNLKLDKEQLQLKLEVQNQMKLLQEEQQKQKLKAQNDNQMAQMQALEELLNLKQNDKSHSQEPIQNIEDFKSFDKSADEQDIIEKESDDAENDNQVLPRLNNNYENLNQIPYPNQIQQPAGKLQYSNHNLQSNLIPNPPSSDEIEKDQNDSQDTQKYQENDNQKFIDGEEEQMKMESQIERPSTHLSAEKFSKSIKFDQRINISGQKHVDEDEIIQFEDIQERDDFNAQSFQNTNQLNFLKDNSYSINEKLMKKSGVESQLNQQTAQFNDSQVLKNNNSNLNYGKQFNSHNQDSQFPNPEINYITFGNQSQQMNLYDEANQKELSFSNQFQNHTSSQEEEEEEGQNPGNYPGNVQQDDFSGQINNNQENQNQLPENQRVDEQQSDGDGQDLRRLDDGEQEENEEQEQGNFNNQRYQKGSDDENNQNYGNEETNSYQENPKEPVFSQKNNNSSKHFLQNQSNYDQKNIQQSAENSDNEERFQNEDIEETQSMIKDDWNQEYDNRGTDEIKRKKWDLANKQDNQDNGNSIQKHPLDIDEEKPIIQDPDNTNQKKMNMFFIDEDDEETKAQKLRILENQRRKKLQEQELLRQKRQENKKNPALKPEDGTPQTKLTPRSVKKELDKKSQQQPTQITSNPFSNQNIPSPNIAGLEKNTNQSKTTPKRDNIKDYGGKKSDDWVEERQISTPLNPFAQNPNSNNNINNNYANQNPFYIEENQVNEESIKISNKNKKNIISFQKPSNLQILQLALTKVCIAGPGSQQQREIVFAQMSQSQCEKFIVLFKGIMGRQDFRAIYTYDYNTDEIQLLYGQPNSPEYLDSSMVQNYYRYDSGATQFKLIVGNQNFHISVDAVSLNPQLMPNQIVDNNQ